MGVKGKVSARVRIVSQSEKVLKPEITLFNLSSAKFLASYFEPFTDLEVSIIRKNQMLQVLVPESDLAAVPKQIELEPGDSIVFPCPIHYEFGSNVDPDSPFTYIILASHGPVQGRFRFELGGLTFEGKLD